MGAGEKVLLRVAMSPNFGEPQEFTGRSLLRALKRWPNLLLCDWRGALYCCSSRTLQNCSFCNWDSSSEDIFLHLGLANNTD